MFFSISATQNKRKIIQAERIKTLKCLFFEPRPGGDSNPRPSISEPYEMTRAFIKYFSVWFFFMQRSF
jgi:hypothetical protein